jgi:hypothetical protein
MQRFVIEKRNPDGSLNFSEPQPERFFGNAAITGITENAIASVVFRHDPDATLDGSELCMWARRIDPLFSTRVKYW